MAPFFEQLVCVQPIRLRVQTIKRFKIKTNDRNDSWMKVGLQETISMFFCAIFLFFFSSGLCLPVVTFFRRISDPEIGSGAVDVYAMMFSCQFIIFIIIVFSWSAFSSPEVFPALSSPEVCRGPAFSVKCSLLLVARHLTNLTNSLHRGCEEVA